MLLVSNVLRDPTQFSSTLRPAESPLRRNLFYAKLSAAPPNAIAGASDQNNAVFAIDLAVFRLVMHETLLNGVVRTVLRGMLSSR